VPFTIADADDAHRGRLRRRGRGEHPRPLLQAGDFNVAECERGIVYIDEIDKIARKSENPSITRDDRARGCSRHCSRSSRDRRERAAPGGRKHPQQEYIQINTKDILFICGGAFDGLEKIIEARTGRPADRLREAETDPIRAGEAGEERVRRGRADDLLRFGLIPELVGRLPVTVPLEGLDEESLVRSSRSRRTRSRSSTPSCSISRK
jgi:ATP-dependent Clp protease ATP-binding subunit ClpX